MTLHDFSIIFVNKSRNVISENKLFAHDLAGSNNGHAKLFLVDMRGIDQINPFLSLRVVSLCCEIAQEREEIFHNSRQQVAKCDF